MFGMKVTMVTIFKPINIILYVSLITSLVAVAGGAIANFNVQTIGINNASYIQSLDLIIITLLNMVVTIWTTVRN